MEKEFVRVRSAKDIIISLSLLIAGGIIVAIPTSVSVNIAGFFMIFAGLILAVILKTGYRLTETGEHFRKKELYFSQSSKETVVKAVSTAPMNLDRKSENKGNGLRVDTYYSHKNGKAYCRVYEYIPYRYEACTPYLEYSTVQVENLIK